MKSELRKPIFRSVFFVLIAFCAIWASDAGLVDRERSVAIASICVIVAIIYIFGIYFRKTGLLLNPQQFSLESNSTDIPLVEAVEYIFPRARLKYWIEAIGCFYIIFTIVWFILIQPAISIFLANNDQEFSAFEVGFLAFVFLMVLIPLVFLLKHLALTLKERHVALTSLAVGMSMTPKSLIVGIALIEGAGRSYLVERKQPNVVLNWEQVQSVEVLPGSSSKGSSSPATIKISVNDPQNTEFPTDWFLLRRCLGKKEMEILTHIQRRIPMPIILKDII